MPRPFFTSGRIWLVGAGKRRLLLMDAWAAFNTSGLVTCWMVRVADIADTSLEDHHTSLTKDSNYILWSYKRSFGDLHPPIVIGLWKGVCYSSVCMQEKVWASAIHLVVWQVRCRAHSVGAVFAMGYSRRDSPPREICSAENVNIFKLTLSSILLERRRNRSWLITAHSLLLHYHHFNITEVFLIFS